MFKRLWADQHFKVRDSIAGGSLDFLQRWSCLLRADHLSEINLLLFAKLARDRLNGWLPSCLRPLDYTAPLPQQISHCTEGSSQCLTLVVRCKCNRPSQLSRGASWERRSLAEDLKSTRGAKSTLANVDTYDALNTSISTFPCSRFTAVRLTSNGCLL